MLKHHYEGTDTRNRRGEDAQECLNQCHYKSETTFTFEKYTCMVKDCSDTMVESEEILTECQKMTRYLKGIQCPQLAPVVSKINMDPNNEPCPHTFTSISNKLAQEVQRLF